MIGQILICLGVVFLLSIVITAVWVDSVSSTYDDDWLNEDLFGKDVETDAKKR